MCGIVGLWRLSRPRITDEEMDRLSERISERGPDGHGSWIHPTRNLGLGHRRLAIIELSEEGAQPKVSASGRLTISFNGEIYNYIELKRALRAEGWSFRGGSDTEVLLVAIEAWGIDLALARADGMFAFGLWDEADGSMYLARDRFGEKPLYYCADEEGLVFGSGLRIILHERSGTLDGQSALALLSWGFIPGGATILQGVRRLGAGRILQIQQYGGRLTLEERPFWSPADALLDRPAHTFSSLAEAASALEPILAAAVSRSCRADVPYGAFLSGGLDSSCVVALMRRAVPETPRTFTIGFDDPAYDESGAAEFAAAALDTNHTTIRLTGDDLLSATRHLSEVCDEPLVDLALIPSFLLARESRKHVTVALTGDGGDELFGGYTRYVAYQRLCQFRALGGGAALAAVRHCSRWATSPIGSATLSSASRILGIHGHNLHEKLAKLAAVSDLSSPIAYYLQALEMTPVGAGECIAQSLETAWLPAEPQASPLSQLRLADLRGYLPDGVLQKADRATMAASLEGRAPFLSAEVAAFALALPDRLLIKGNHGKLVLRELGRRLLPVEITRRGKAGFAPPIRAWLAGPLQEYARDTLSIEASRRHGLFCYTAIEQAWSRALSGDVHACVGIWRMVILQNWASRFLK